MDTQSPDTRQPADQQPSAEPQPETWELEPETTQAPASEAAKPQYEAPPAAPPPYQPPATTPPYTPPPTQPPTAPPGPGAAYTGPPPGSSAGAWLSAGWDLVKENLGMAVVLAIILMIPSLLGGLMGNVMNQASMRGLGGGLPTSMGLEALFEIYRRSLGTNLIISIPVAILNVLLWIGGLACIWDALRTRRLTLDSIGVGFSMPGPAIVLGLILLVVQWVVGLTAMICIGVLLAFPAMSFAHLAQYDLAVRRQDGVSAASAAWALLMANFWELTLLGLLGVVVIILGVICCCVGVLVTYPVVLAAYAYCYADLGTRAGLLQG